MKWMGVQLTDTGLSLSIVDSPKDEGKLSLHASGMVGFRANNLPGQHQLRVQGNYLFDYKNKGAGVRHLISTFMEEPENVSISSDFVPRQSDFIIENKSTLKPFVIINTFAKTKLKK